MTTETPENSFFRPPRETTLADDEVCNHVRAEFYEIQTRFLDRLACARVFDRERFEAILLWLETLRRCCTVADLPMLASDFAQFSSIAAYLEQEATYSKDQREECAAAHSQWLGIMRDYKQLPEQKS